MFVKKNGASRKSIWLQRLNRNTPEQRKIPISWLASVGGEVLGRYPRYFATSLGQRDDSRQVLTHVRFPGRLVLVRAMAI